MVQFYIADRRTEEHCLEALKSKACVRVVGMSLDGNERGFVGLIQTIEPDGERQRVTMWTIPTPVDDPDPELTAEVVLHMSAGRGGP
jgi:hypothetical protein